MRKRDCPAEKTTTATTTFIVHADHLGGSNVVSDASGNIAQVIDYYPYGSLRINVQNTSLDEKRKYIGQYYDEDTELSYLNARYYDGARGQFTSQDPVFWEDPLRQNLQNPQSLNSYSYAENNPIVKSDPTGRCVGPLVAVCGAALVGAAGGVIFQGFNDYLTGEFSERTWRENLATYAVAAGEGAFVGVVTGGAGLAAKAARFGTAAKVITTGGATFGSTVGATYGGNAILGQPTDLGTTITSGVVSGVTAGTLSTLSQVRGVLPRFNSNAFYTGAHTQRQAAEELLVNSVNTFSQTVTRFSQQNYSAGGGISGGGGGNLSGLVSQLQSLVSSLKGLVSSLSGNKSTQ